MKFTVGTAAKETGKAKSTISRYISKGRISAAKAEDGSYEIDASELFRVFPKSEQSNRFKNSQKERSATQKNTDETGVLCAKLEAADKLISDKDKTIDDLRHRLDKSEDERRRTSEQLMGLLTNYQEPKASQKSSEGRIARAWAALTGKL